MLCFSVWFRWFLLFNEQEIVTQFDTERSDVIIIIYTLVYFIFMPESPKTFF